MEKAATFAETAALLGDASRAAMLLAMLDGRAYTANELACAANIAPPTASFHLDKMVKAGFLEPLRQGRYRYFRLTGTDVARTLEAVLALQYAPLPRRIVSNCPAHLREARTCFDHIAGKLGVRIYQAVTRKGWTVVGSAHLGISAAAENFLGDLDIAPKAYPLHSRPCLDWSEREFHFSGEFGSVLLQAMLSKRWVLQGSSRLLTVTEEGRRRLAIWKM
ncbi:MAG: helix-turn-helix domain-containing protein [Bryocella sp.]